VANLYYREDLPDEAFEVGATVEVTGDEARHAVRVSRLRVGEQTLVGNGAGALGRGETVLADRDRFAVRLDEVRFEPVPACELVLVQALAKGDRDERAVEQATEFGVDRIVPWQSERSVSRWDGGEKRDRGVEKWARIAREASKQSLRARVPGVADPTTLERLGGLAGRDGSEVVVLHPGGGLRLSEWAGGPEARAAAQIVLVVGPEGGLGDREIDALEAAGAHVRVLGGTVLRTSSAGPAAIAVLNAALSRW
jgi:16S rRNA (uracil1498-N3)-methyltransferase